MSIISGLEGVDGISRRAFNMLGTAKVMPAIYSFVALGLGTLRLGAFMAQGSLG